MNRSRVFHARAGTLCALLAAAAVGGVVAEHGPPVVVPPGVDDVAAQTGLVSTRPSVPGGVKERGVPLPPTSLDVGVNIDVHQDIPFPPFPNDFHIEGRIESGVPGGNNPPELIDHVDDVFPLFSYSIVPDPDDPGGNWYLFTADWSLPPGDPGIPYCMTIHLGLLFDVQCHNVMIDLSGWWTRDGAPIFAGQNGGFWPMLGFRVDEGTPDEVPIGQYIRIQNGNLDGLPEPGEIEVEVVQMDLASVSAQELTDLLGPEPFRELREGGLQDLLPWVPVLKDGIPISEFWPEPVPPDSFFDVVLDGPWDLTPATPMRIEPGGYLIARELMRFYDNAGMPDFRWVWEMHQAHEADLGDAPDSSNSWGAIMTAYPAGGPPGVIAQYPTVYGAGSPPHGPIHWQPRVVAFLGNAVSAEFEADVGPDEDGWNNLDPPGDLPDLDFFDDGVNVPMALPHCQATRFPYTITVVQPINDLYVNVWFDWERDGHWDETPMCDPVTPAPDWAVQNQHLVGLTPGTYTFQTPPFVPWHAGGTADVGPIWMRITLAEEPAVPGAAAGSGGSGPAAGYDYGETEDYYFTPLEEGLPPTSLDVGVNIDIHQDMMFGLPPNDFHIEGRIESGVPGVFMPPVLLDHIDDKFPFFDYVIEPDPAAPEGNWYIFRGDWSGTDIQFCQTLHLGLLFDVNCHNVIIDLVGWWTRDGELLPFGLNAGHAGMVGFRVDQGSALRGELSGQVVRIQNGPAPMEVAVVDMDVYIAQDREELELVLGPAPFRELREDGAQQFLPWTQVVDATGNPISDTNEVFLPPDSFFDVVLSGDGMYRPEVDMVIPPGGFLIGRELLRFFNNEGVQEYHWVWEMHEGHQADLGDAPDSTNTWGLGMTAYPANLPATFPTVYLAGSPPHGPIHWQPSAVAFLGPMVSAEAEADLMPDQDGLTNIDPPLNANDQDGFDDGVHFPIAMPHCQPTSFIYDVTVVLPINDLYLNVWCDWNRDADWDDTMACPLNPLVPEWAVQNHNIGPLTPGFYTLATPMFTAFNLAAGASPEMWMRVTLSEQPYQPGPVIPGWGGSGPASGYDYGETEDYYFEPAGNLEACCDPINGWCQDMDPLQCSAIDGVPQGPGTVCTVPEACCLSDGTCLMVDPLCCDEVGGIPQGPFSQCTQGEACCLGDGTCLDVDPLCCDEMGGVPQGPGTGCVDMLVPCCLPDGSCIHTDPLCCDEAGGVPSPHGAAVCAGDVNQNGVNDACEGLVVCEPQGDPNPVHPPTYWYDSTQVGYCDFHVRVFDPNPADYTNVIAPNNWVFQVHQLPNGEWWASWWDPTVDCQYALFAPFRFSFDNANPSTWGDWTVTTSNTNDPYNQAFDASWNHPTWPDGYGYRVHVPREPVCEPTPDGLACEGPCPQDPEVCVPRVIRHHLPQPFFPDAGTDTLSPTTGYVDVQYPPPSSIVERYYINPDQVPNVTRIIRESPAQVGAHREMAAEIIETSLVADGRVGRVMIRESPTRASAGIVVGAEGGVSDYPADSFFDVFVEIDIPDMGIYGLYNEAPIPMEATGISSMPPSCSPTDCDAYHSAAGWQGVDMLDPTGQPTGFRIVAAEHVPPPPPPEWEVIDCQCLSPDVCHIEQGMAAEPVCMGGCPGTQVCHRVVTPVDPFTVDYRCECVGTEACCVEDGTCVDTALWTNECADLGGDPQGPNTDCASAVCVPLKWSQPPTFSPSTPHPECFYGWDEVSIYGSWQIVADDWLCQDGRPVSDIHWWGSYVGWDGTQAPPKAPDRFHVAIWTDVPAGQPSSETCCHCWNEPPIQPPPTCGANPIDAQKCLEWGTPEYEHCDFYESARCVVDHCEPIEPLPYSHPGVLVKEWIVSRAELNERPVACDWHPEHMPPGFGEGCFRYDFVIPEGDEFVQEEACSIYWLSITAIYPPPWFCECNGDWNGDGIVDMVDMTQFVDCLIFPQFPQCDWADLDCDGDVDNADAAIMQCQFNSGFPDPACCVQVSPVNPWGWKTRQPAWNDDAVRVLDPTRPAMGSGSVQGEPIENAEGSWDMAFVLTSRGAPPCVDVYDCGDLDGNGITDDVCTWFACEAGECDYVAKAVPSDLGGSFGTCPTDSFCNIHDANHALSCFASQNTCDTLNIDAGGSFGTCVADGFCNIHDANHALACFAGLNTCTCPPTPGPETAPAVVGAVDLRVASDRLEVSPGDTIQVRVFVDGKLDALQGYQLHLAASGGRRGSLEPVDVGIEQRKDHVFAGRAETFDAFNVVRGQMLAGLIDVTAAAGGSEVYLATYTFRVSADAAGTFVVDVLHDESAGAQTYLIAPRNGKVEVRSTTPAVIAVRPASASQSIR